MENFTDKVKEQNENDQIRQNDQIPPIPVFEKWRFIISG